MSHQSFASAGTRSSSCFRTPSINDSSASSGVDPYFCRRRDPVGGAFCRQPVVRAGRSNHNPHALVGGRYSAVGVWDKGSHSRTATFAPCWVAQVVRLNFSCAIRSSERVLEEQTGIVNRPTETSWALRAPLQSGTTNCRGGRRSASATARSLK